ncbi:glycosyltransferase [Peribacillus simplex]|uniref:glycosyltransferase n=1 Tax=Peribacillus simplex TaxID=1478 RepID=UPI00366B08D9
MNMVVSINCITYNHEDYIADAIEGFLMQKTNFEFEILIGEDCSTDNTRKIVEKYIIKYPEKIRLITSDKNVGARMNFTRLREHSKGKYIAVCEGDDYWTDSSKLQKQIDYLENNPECTLCFHNAKVIGPNKNPTGRLHIPWSNFNSKYYYGKSCSYSAGEMALLDFIPTASIVFPKHLMNNPPEWYFKAIYGDAPMRLILSEHGYAYYIDEVMSAYRTGMESSAMKVLAKIKQVERFKAHIDILDNFDRYSNYKFSAEIDKAKLQREFQLNIEERKLGLLRNTKYKEFYDQYSKIDKVKLYARSYFPNTFNKLLKLKSFF